MKNTQMVDIPKKRQIFYIIALSLIVFIFTISMILISVEMSRLNINNTVEVSGKVSSVIAIGEEESRKYQITLENGKTYQIYSVIAEKMDFDELKTIENGNATLHTLKEDIVFGIDSATFSFDTEKGLQIQRDNLKIGLIVVGVGITIFLTMLVCLIIHTVKLAKQKQIDFLENFYQEYRTTPARKSYLLKVLISIIVIFVVFLPIILIEGNKNDTSTIFYVVFFSFLGLCVIWGVLTISFLPVIRKKDIELYNQMYDFENFKVEGDIENSFLDMANDQLVKFEETGISLDKENMRSLEQKMFDLMAELESNKDGNLDKDAYKEALKQQFNESVTSQNPEYAGVIPYDELKLHLKVIFRHTGSITAFIVSDLPQENKYNLKNDIIVEFSPDSYYFIKKFNVKVDGVDNFMKNRLELMQKYCKRKPNIQTITD